ncbi:hypothetical protein [Paenibacillus sp. MBLB4367]|uniref:hypothetical protein n=1 Tax=Paenibacillus sp. MBLB4367 TaxID=3384767 RepID=UPI003907EB2B
MRKFTIVFTIIGAALCLVHYMGLDPKSMLLFSFSVPLWFVPIFVDIRDVNLYFVYFLTIVSWGLLGYAVDWYVNRYRTRRYSK